MHTGDTILIQNHNMICSIELSTSDYVRVLWLHSWSGGKGTSLCWYHQQILYFHVVWNLDDASCSFFKWWLAVSLTFLVWILSPVGPYVPPHFWVDAGKTFIFLVLRNLSLRYVWVVVVCFVYRKIHQWLLSFFFSNRGKAALRPRGIVWTLIYVKLFW